MENRKDTAREVIQEELLNRIPRILSTIIDDVFDAIHNSIEDINLETDLVDYIEDLVIHTIKENKNNRKNG